MIPTMEEAQALLEKYNKETFHLRHAAIVSGVMGYFAKEYDPDRVEYWKGGSACCTIFDFEAYPEQHVSNRRELMREEGLDEGASAPRRATATGSAATSSRSTSWRRSSSPPTSSPG